LDTDIADLSTEIQNPKAADKSVRPTQAGETVAMPKRNLRIIKPVKNVPVIGAHLPVCLDFKNGKLYPNERPGLGVELGFQAIDQDR
jgi:hypothetical protein